MNQYNCIARYKFIIQCKEPLHIGSAVGDKSEVLVHPISKVPFIQASSITGALRDCYLKCYGSVDTDELFGARKLRENSNAAEYSGHVRIEDGIFKKNVKMELRPHVKINRQTGSVTSESGSGQKFDMEYIGAGAECEVEAYVYWRKEQKDYSKEFEQLLSKMKAGEISLGAKKSSGAGDIEIIELKKRVYDLTKEEDRSKWIQGISDDDLADYLDKIADDGQGTDKYIINVSGSTEGAIQIKGISVNGVGKDAPDSRNMKNIMGNYIVPGSSLKGAVRSQTEKIAAYIGCETLIPEMFGSGGDKSKNGKKGNLRFYDTVIGDRESIDKMPMRNRIHIDKFTGGVISTGLFKESNAAGDLNIRITIGNYNNPEASLGLIVYALRDLAIGTMSLGNGYSTGKGIINVDTIDICSVGDGKKACIDIKNSCVNDEDMLIANALKAVKSVNQEVEA